MAKRRKTKTSKDPTTHYPQMYTDVRIYQEILL